MPTSWERTPPFCKRGVWSESRCSEGPGLDPKLTEINSSLSTKFRESWSPWTNADLLGRTQCPGISTVDAENQP